MNKRSAICSVVVVMSSMTVLAQDSQSGIIHINGGANTVAIGATAQQPNAKGIEPAAHPFYDNIGTSGYQQYVGYAVCDGISACGGEQQAMHQPGRRSQSEPPLSGNGQEHAHFPDTNSQVVSFNCAATLTKGKKYWVLIVAPPDADLAWNFSSSAQAGIVLGHNDRWGAYQSHNSTGALTIQ